MDVHRDDTAPATQPAPEDDRVVWLFDPEVHCPPGPLSCSPAELFGVLDTAADRMGLSDVAVTGVVAGLRRRGRWCSFELAEHDEDHDSPVGLVKVVLLSGVAARVEAALARGGQRLDDGVRATVSGAVRFDAAWGSVRIVGRAVEVHEERADVAARRDALVAELAATGLDRAQAGLVVPGRPLRIGVIAREGTAGEADVAALLEGSGLEWRLTRRSVPMAGPEAPARVAAALDQLARGRPDVILIARGGGGRGELACWDSEVLARAIAACPVPVWTAIGHATDATVADPVANRACATPSAAAAALVERVRDFERRRHERAATPRASARPAPEWPPPTSARRGRSGRHAKGWGCSRPSP